VLIRTRPLSQGNYGGILQAYAMQRALRRLGLRPVTDLSRGDEVRTASMRGVATRAIKNVAVKANLPGLTPRAWVSEALRGERDGALRDFVSERIDAVSLHDSTGAIDTGVLESADVFLVGSDQVWRGAFGRVPSYLFDFLSADDPRPRIAYAASFGTEDISEYSPELRRVSREMAQRFRALSVREASAVGICSAEWNMAATHVLDPTMLLTVDDYAELQVRQASRSAPKLVSYVLDQGADAGHLVDQVSSHIGSPPRSLLPPDPPTLSAHRRTPEIYARPSVEEWVAAIAAAQFMVTDSFHGTVFAILHHVPFVTLANHARGAARFRSLLELFGLEDRLCEPGTALSGQVLDSTPDWERVETVLLRERARSLAFLRDALGLPAED
jgi:hypothetical protein